MEESGRRKRKMGNEEERDKEDEEEEEKVEKSFALIRSTREVRDRLMNAVVPNEPKEEEKVSNAAAAGGCQWKPMFRAEDFMEDSVSRSKNPLVLKDAGPSSKTKHEPEKESKDGGGEGGDDGGLNLNLSLSL